jgi:uncharacterized protein (UPF0332 family)
MSFNPKELIKVASHLGSLEDKEEHVRSMVNRAYYAAFGAAKIKTGICNKNDIHKLVIAKLKSSKDKSAKNAGLALDSLRDLRRKADYEYDIKLVKTRCANVINDATYIIQELDKIVQLKENNDQDED